MTIEVARKQKNMSRRDVSEWLGIPYRTLSGWENGERTCPAYIEKLIVEKIIRGKEEKEMTNEIYRVTEIGKNDEWEHFKSENKEEAIAEARYFSERSDYPIEIRVYEEDIEDDNCSNFDYYTVEF